MIQETTKIQGHKEHEADFMFKNLTMVALLICWLLFSGCGVDKPVGISSPLAPASGENLPPLSASQEKQLNLAYARLLKGQAREALALYLELQKTAPQNPQVLTGLTEVYLAQKDYPQAKTVLKTALSQDPEDGKALMLSGKLAQETGKPREAIKFYLAVPETYPDYDTALSNAAQVYLEINRPREAQKLLKKALQLYPNFDEGMYYLASAYMKMGKPGLAVYYLKLAASFNPEWLKEAREDKDLGKLEL